MTEPLLQQLRLLPDYLGHHLFLSLVAIAVGTSLSMPLAWLAMSRPRLRGTIMAIASTVQTIPGLALLALMVPLFGRIGFLPAAVALILYSVLPVLRNTVTGLEGIDPDLIEAGRGLGMTARQLLFRVRLPLALPVIVAGIRTATVWVVGLATLSTPVGATSLGNYIFSGLQTQNYTSVTVGCVAAAALALILDRLIRFFELALGKRRRRLAAGSLAIVAIVAILLAVGGLGLLWQTTADDRTEFVIGTKTFTEQYVLGTLITDELAKDGYRARLLESLGSTVAFDALVAGRIDAYVDYTGTIWANYMRRSDNPGRAAIATGVRRWLDDNFDIEVVAELGFENAYALAMREADAAARSIGAIDDLGGVSAGLRIGGDYEFFNRPEWASIESVYGLSFEKEISMDSTLMYQALRSGEVDVISAFSTDGRIPAFGLRVLADPRGALPPYDAVVLIAPGTRERAPELASALSRLDGVITAQAMRDANKLVDLDGLSVREAARRLAESIDTRNTGESVE